MGRQRWILLIYKVPPAPARYRIAVWRKLKKLGVLYMQKSVCLLPDNAYLRDEVENIAHDIENFGGEATLVFTDKIEKEAKLVEAFQGQSNTEYTMIIKKVEKCLSALSKKNLRRREIKGVGKALEDLRKAFADTQRNDWFGANRGKETEKKLKTCEGLYLQIVRGV